MTEPCGCGCGEPRRGNSAYAHDACRTRAWKQRTGYVRENAGNGTQKRKRRSPDRRLSLGRGVDEVVAEFQKNLSAAGVSTSRARERTVAALTRALPPSAREGGDT